MFWSLFIFRGHLTREPASVFCTMSRVTYFTLRAHTRTGVSHSQHRKTRERLWKNAGEWIGRVEITTEEIPGCVGSMHGYILTILQALEGEPMSSGFSTDGSL